MLLVNAALHTSRKLASFSSRSLSTGGNLARLPVLCRPICLCHAPIRYDGSVRAYQPNDDVSNGT